MAERRFQAFLENVNTCSIYSAHYLHRLISVMLHFSEKILEVNDYCDINISLRLYNFVSSK
jgi:hypothetical protein